VFRVQGLDPCGKLTLIEPEGTRRLGKPKLRWLASVEELETYVTGSRPEEDSFGKG